jgi:hypothetical protein
VDVAPQPDDHELIRAGDPLADVVHVEVVGPLTLFVRFDDGVAGRVQFLPSHLTGVFELLRDPHYFAQVRVAHGAVSWPIETPDLAPDAMHAAIARDGEWTLD